MTDPPSHPLTTRDAITGLPALVDKAARALAGARSSAEVLEAREMAGFAYDAAKRAGRLAKAKGAHDSLIAAAHRAQADALEIETKAKQRLAEEYDAAQDRGEVAPEGRPKTILDENSFFKPTAADIAPGLTKLVHEGRLARAAEKACPGIVRRTLVETLERGKEPTKAAVDRVINAVAKPITFAPSLAEQVAQDRAAREAAVSRLAHPLAEYFVGLMPQLVGAGMKIRWNEHAEADLVDALEASARSDEAKHINRTLALLVAWAKRRQQ
ncbi:hypothetical protein SAMN05519104_4328 [Rhizobiales bacterium GAS188]|nr:hypothetical protein SAMN05519104_4328 [Rhizobiales bacterium GAS188]